MTGLEQQVLVPLFGEAPVELGLAGKEDLALGVFKQDGRYQRLFSAAFPGDTDPFTVSNVAKVLALAAPSFLATHLTTASFTAATVTR